MSLFTGILIVYFVVSIVYLLVFQQEDFTSTIPPQNVFQSKFEKAKIIDNFNHLVTFNKIPDTSTFIKEPYYLPFVYKDLGNQTVIGYIQNRLQGTDFNNDQLRVIKDPYDVYRISASMYIFSTNVENTTHFFTQLYRFYVQTDGKSMTVLACDLIFTFHQLSFVESNSFGIDTTNQFQI